MDLSQFVVHPNLRNVIVNCRYNKTEELAPGSREMMEYTHLMIGVSHTDSRELLPYAQSHNLVAKVEGFDGIFLDYNKFPPLQIKTSTKIWILKKKRNKTR